MFRTTRVTSRANCIQFRFHVWPDLSHLEVNTHSSMYCADNLPFSNGAFVGEERKLVEFFLKTQAGKVTYMFVYRRRRALISRFR